MLAAFINFELWFLFTCERERNRNLREVKGSSEGDSVCPWPLVGPGGMGHRHFLFLGYWEVKGTTQKELLSELLFNPNTNMSWHLFKVLDATKRLGCEEMEGYGPLKAHSFFESITWENLHHQTPPKLTAYLPAMSEDDEDCYGNVSWLMCVRNNPGRDGFCLSYFVKVVPLCLGSLCPSTTELWLMVWRTQGEASIDLDTWQSKSESLTETEAKVGLPRVQVTRPWGGQVPFSHFF